jgi:type I restriction enzyme R subunit
MCGKEEYKIFSLHLIQMQILLQRIAQELTAKLRGSVSVDWQKRESVRAKMRNMIRIILRKYKYPPDKQAQALELVMQQAEVLSDEWTK